MYSKSIQIVEDTETCLEEGVGCVCVCPLFADIIDGWEKWFDSYRWSVSCDSNFPILLVFVDEPNEFLWRNIVPDVNNLFVTDRFDYIEEFFYFSYLIYNREVFWEKNDRLFYEDIEDIWT